MSTSVYLDLYKDNKRQLTETRLRINTLLNSINESSRLDEAKAKKLLAEAILVERQLIIEAAGKDPQEMASMLDGMVLAIEKLAGRLGIDKLVTQMEAVHIPTDVELDSMSLNKTALKKFQKEFTDVAVIARGLIAIADDIGDLTGGESGKLAEIISTVMATGEGKQNTLGQALWQYDKSLGGLRKKNTRQTFALAVQQILKSKAPGMLKLVDQEALLKGMMGVQAQKLVTAMKAFNGMISQFVDNEFLMKISSAPGGVMGILKRIGGMISGMGSAPTR